MEVPASTLNFLSHVDLWDIHASEKHIDLWSLHRGLSSDFEHKSMLPFRDGWNPFLYFYSCL